MRPTNSPHSSTSQNNRQLRRVVIFISLLINCYMKVCAEQQAAQNETSALDSSKGSLNEQKLECQPGEQRHFNYESNTSVWGSQSQQVIIKAALRLRCLEPTTNGTLKYMAEVVELNAQFVAGKGIKGRQGKRQSYNNQMKMSGELRVEPVLEEVGEAISEAADKVRRSVSDWFSKTWDSVKDFFVDVFSSSDKSTSSREQVFKESGIDIMQQCKSGSKQKPSVHHQLPVDDSVFDDLEPRYYVGASSDGTTGPTYEFDHQPRHEEEDTQDANLSFFDDPKPTRGKRSNMNKKPNSDAQGVERERLIRLPFVMVQAQTGRMIEIQFGERDTDTSIRNFKRHLCDLFATNLDQNKSIMNEISPIGQHATKYLTSENSSLIEQTLINEAMDGSGWDREQLVKVLPSHATQHSTSETFASLSEGRNHDCCQGDGQLSVLRTINSTSPLKFNSRSSAPEFEQVEVHVKQLQRISDGRMTGSTGKLGMSLISVGQKRSRFKRMAEQPDSDAGVDISDLLQVSSSFTMQLIPIKLSKPVTIDLTRQRRSFTGATNQTELLVSRASSLGAEHLKNVLAEWRSLESKLHLTKSSLKAESAGPQEGHMQRLELLRDHIQLRMNEDQHSNKLGRLRSIGSSQRLEIEPKQANADLSSGGLIGLSLSQLILDTGVSSRRKGDMYSHLEEALELESDLGEEAQLGSITRLLRDTARLDKLRSHCRSAIATRTELKAEMARIELRPPFNVWEPDESAPGQLQVNKLASTRSKRLSQCKRVLRVLLHAGLRPAGDLTLELVDHCNEQLVDSVKHEELGYGPTSRYYRQLRQQFIELLSELRRPSEQLIDNLLARLSWAGQESGKRRARRPATDGQDFALLPPTNSFDNGSFWRQLGDDDDYNNNDANGALVMAITELGAKSSIGQSKRLELIDRLLTKGVRASSCSALASPDIDVLEALANFEEPIDEMANRLIQVVKRCRSIRRGPPASDQYLVACMHALQGQLKISSTQKLLAELLRAPETSCLLKSEILQLLVTGQQTEDLRRAKVKGSLNLAYNQHEPTVADLALAELIEGPNRVQERKCLGNSASLYLASKSSGRQEIKTTARPVIRRSSRRSRRSVPNSDGFWDEAQCKRWTLPAIGVSADVSPSFSSTSDLEDNSIQSASKSQSLQPLIEREGESNSSANLSRNSSLWSRRRHKCSASKKFGPKGAQASVRAELVNELVGPRDDKFLARFRLGLNLMGHQLDVGRMYLWHQQKTTRAHVNILGKSIWDTARSCEERAPHHLAYMPLFDVSLWLLKLSVGLRLQSEMGFLSNCPPMQGGSIRSARATSLDDLELRPSILLRASAEASAKFVVARVGMSLAGQYGYQGNIRVSRQPESCMSVESAHEPMNLTLSSWYQLWDDDCHFWGSRGSAEPQATRWRLSSQKPSTWIQDECLNSQAYANGSKSEILGSRLQLSTPGSINI